MVTTMRFQKGLWFGLLVALCLLHPTVTCGQTSRTIPWKKDDDLTKFSVSVNTYHPEPIIFVHGIVSSRLTWEFVIANLHNQGWFQPYHYVSEQFEAAKESNFNTSQEDYSELELSTLPSEQRNQWRDFEKPYLHTFNYGRHAKRLPDGTTRWWTRVRPNRQTHDPIDWNSWEAPSDDYLVGRTTLDDRVEEIRDAYKMPGQTRPNVILIGHSLGGLMICNYLMMKNQNLGTDPYVPVRRVVTINTLLWGSPIANALANWDNMQNSPWQDVLQGIAGFVLSLASPQTGTWIENHDGVTKEALAIDLQAAQTKGNIPQILTGSGFLAEGGSFTKKLPTVPLPTTTEFVTSGTKDPNPPPGKIKVLVGSADRYADIDVALKGDGLVPLDSMAGYNGDGTPVFTNLSPVDIRGYLYTSETPLAANWLGEHTEAPRKMGTYPLLLDGVSYVTGPRPERPGGWSGFQKQYSGSPSDGTFTHTDEPGIADLKLLYQREEGNPLLVPAFDTWTTSSSGRQKTLTNATDFASHQIIAAPGGGYVRYLGTAGAKNRSEDPVDMGGTNYWVQEGNEYLPASLMVNCDSDVAPRPVAENINTLADPKPLVTKCLVQLYGDGIPQYQYGYFESPLSLFVTPNTNNYVAAQGYNLAKLLTPQAERAFNTPVNSETLVGILKKINEGESLSNACHNATEPTRWTAPVDEWITTPASGVFKLNFFPTDDPDAFETLYDAWTEEAYNVWDYDVHNNQITLTDLGNAPSQLLGSYEAYLGTEKGFTNSYDGVVPKLDDANLAGVQITATQLGQIRTALEHIIPKYKDTNTTTCANWTVPEILDYVHHGTNTWIPIDDDLVLPKHFTELKNVIALLATEISCCSTGACCLTNGTCSQLSHFACTNRGGIYYGDGSVCSNVSCCGCNPPLPDTIKLTQSVEFFLGEYFPFNCGGNPGNHGIWDVNTCPAVITLSKTSPCNYASGSVGAWHHNQTIDGKVVNNVSGTYFWTVSFGTTITITCATPGWGSAFEGTITRSSSCLPVTVPNSITVWHPCGGGHPGQGGSATLEIP